MAGEGRIIIAEPEDYILAGEELEELITQLTPYGEQLHAVLGAEASDDRETASRGEQILSADQICREAIHKTLDTLERAPTNKELQYIINSCWDKSDETANLDTHDVKSERAESLSYSFWRSLSLGTIAIRKGDSRIVLAETISS